MQDRDIGVHVPRYFTLTCITSSSITGGIGEVEFVVTGCYHFQSLNQMSSS